MPKPKEKNYSAVALEILALVESDGPVTCVSFEPDEYHDSMQVMVNVRGGNSVCVSLSHADFDGWHGPFVSRFIEQERKAKKFSDDNRD